jgi:hypothetical protein
MVAVGVTVERGVPVVAGVDSMPAAEPHEVRTATRTPPSRSRFTVPPQQLQR